MIIQQTKLVEHPASRAKAEQCAELLAEYMKENLGGEWETRVWHNLYWCWCVEIGSLGLYYHVYGDEWSFSAMLSGETGKRSGALGAWYSHVDNSDDPVKAVTNAMQRARNYIEKLDSSIFDLQMKLDNNG